MIRGMKLIFVAILSVLSLNDTALASSCLEDLAKKGTPYTFNLNLYNPYKYDGGDEAKAANSNCYRLEFVLRNGQPEYVVSKYKGIKGTNCSAADAKGTEILKERFTPSPNLATGKPNTESFVTLKGADDNVAADKVGVRVSADCKLEFAQYDDGSQGYMSSVRDLPTGAQIGLTDSHSLAKLQKEHDVLKAEIDAKRARGKKVSAKDETKLSDLSWKLLAFKSCEDLGNIKGCVEAADNAAKKAEKATKEKEKDVSKCDAFQSGTFNKELLAEFCAEKDSAGTACDLDQCKAQYATLNNASTKDQSGHYPFSDDLKKAHEALAKAQKAFNAEVFKYLKGQKAAKNPKLGCINLKSEKFLYHQGIELVRALNADNRCDKSEPQEQPTGGAPSTR